MLPYILKTVWCMNTILWYYESVWPQNKCMSLWPIFHGPMILSYILKTVWCMNTILWYYESVWPNVWPKNKCRSLWPIFHGPVILPYILKTDVWTSYFRIMSQYDLTFDLKINVGRFDLYFMVQWFCLISWRLFDVWTSYFDQILCVASLGVGKGCIMFWGWLDQNFGVHGNRKPPLTYNGENSVSTFSRLFFIRSFLYLQVTKTCIKSQTSLNFG